MMKKMAGILVLSLDSNFRGLGFRVLGLNPKPRIMRTEEEDGVVTMILWILTTNAGLVLLSKSSRDGLYRGFMRLYKGYRRVI